MPLYRRGPGFLARPLSPATAWPLQHAYGPPDDREGRAAGELDLPLFSLYFLLAETLATFVGYRIAQHCLRGCRVWFLSPTARMWIGVCYCSLKISLVRVSLPFVGCVTVGGTDCGVSLSALQIDYAFHDSAYFKCSLLIMVWYFVYAVLALGFHFGPLQFLFFDYIPRSKMTRSLYHRAALVCQQVSSRLEFYVLQRWLSLPPVLDDATAVVPAAAVSQPAQSIASPPPAGFSRVVGFFGRVVEVHIAQWNLSVCHQWAIALASGGRGAAARLDGVPDCFEARFIFMMQRDGLLLGFFLMVRTRPARLELREG